MHMHARLRWGKIVVLVALGVAALGWVVMALWNWLLPAVFAGAREIGYLQAMGLLLLSRILFGGFHGRGGHAHWRQHRLAQMTPEEREKFQAGLRGCCGKSAE
jgi:hypothetical protein